MKFQNEQGVQWILLRRNCLQNLGAEYGGLVGPVLLIEAAEENKSLTLRKKVFQTSSCREKGAILTSRCFASQSKPEKNLAKEFSGFCSNGDEKV